ncbi:MAG: multi-sensor hybrid histidine kinase, partial [Fibrobacteres bacterium]|nr:multi-sensor hybrid histidine kinase [Fibrobacterota bacterium]
MWFASSAAKRLRYPVSLLVLASLYFVAGRLGLSLASVNPSASAVWPPTGIAIAAITLLGRRMWPAIMVGSFLVNLAQTGRSDSSLAIAVGNTAEALAGAWFLVRAGGARAFGDPRSIFRFIALSGMLSTAISATVGVTTLLLSGLAIRGDLWRIWLNWWVGDSISAWILTPLLVMAASVKVRRNLSKWRILETTALVLGLGLVHLLVFGGLIPGSARLYLLGYLGIPLFLCVAFRFGPLAASMAVTGSSIIAIWGTVGARGPFAPEDPDLSLVLLQLYLGSVSVTMVILAAVVKSYKNTGTELYHRQKRLDSIISSVPGIVWEIWRRQDEAAMHLDYVSPYVESMLGYTAEQWLSKPGFWLTIVHPDDKERLARETSEALAEGKDRVSTSRWIAKDGRVVEVESRSVVFLDPEGKPEGMLGVTMDITERRKTEERLRVAEEQVRYAQKMEAVGRLAGGVAHDFNNLLTAILGYCDLLLAKMQSPGPMTSYAKEIRGAAERAAALTRQLLAFSRKEIVQPRPMDLNGLIGYMDPALRRLLGGGIRLETSLHPDLYSLKADRNQIEQLITNLVENSRDAMPQGGAIAIETANARIPEEGSGFFLKPKCEDCVRLTVRDEGSGIPKEAMPHLFDPFFTTKSKTKGSGLGLSTVYAILERSGGGVR